MSILKDNKKTSTSQNKKVSSSKQKAKHKVSLPKGSKKKKPSLRIGRCIAALLLVFLCFGWGGWRIWNSDYIQMRYVYMWDYQQDIITYSQKNKIDPFLVAAIIKNESGFNNKAVSPVGAIGLMQIMPETGEWIAKQMGLPDYDKDKLYQAKLNIRMGCWYVSELDEEFKHNLALIMIAYNAGRGQAKIWMQENGWTYDFNEPSKIPYPDTREYVQNVLKDRDRYYLYYKDKVNSNNPR